MRGIFQTKVVEKVLPRVLCSVIFFPPENRSVREIMWENVADTDMPRDKIYYGTCALHAR